MEKEKETPKTMLCNWCNKRRLFLNGYYLGKSPNGKEYFICSNCNLKKDIV
jgi:hypothetical protein